MQRARHAPGEGLAPALGVVPGDPLGTIGRRAVSSLEAPMKGDKHYYVESFDTVEVTSFRLDQSPFADRYVTDETVFGVYCDRLYPLRLTDNEDPVTLYWKLRRNVLLYDVPEKPLEIVGPDAARLLDRVLACRVETLPVGRCRYGIACREDGTVLMDGVVMRLSGDRFWYVKANGDVRELAGGKRHRPRRRGLRPRFAGTPDPGT